MLRTLSPPRSSVSRATAITRGLRVRSAGVRDHLAAARAGPIIDNVNVASTSRARPVPDHYFRDAGGLLLSQTNRHALKSHTRYFKVFASGNSCGSTDFVRAFHASSPRRGVPIVAALLGALKSSTALGVLGTTFRVALTFIPAFLIKTRIIRKFLHKHLKDAPHLEHKRPGLLRKLFVYKWIIRALYLVPTALLVATLLASLERAPLTGRWRFILLSPTEEEEIVNTLKSTWRSAVDGVLAATLDDGVPPPAIPTTDWRHHWVESTLRRLENAVPLLQSDPASKIHYSLYNGEYPFPPPSAYPLVARPRPAQIVHSWICSNKKARMDADSEDAGSGTGEQGEGSEHGRHRHEVMDENSLNLIGPPYSCLVVDNPRSQNAFSYGFGPGGAGGVVVYTGFLDEVLQNTPPFSPQPRGVAPPSNSLFSRLFGSLLVAPRRNYHYQPTEQQTSELAVLLAHELAHLLLAHHLETLSSTSILFPSVLSIFTDIARTVLFPVTMLFGPFVNDALAQMGKAHSGEVGKLSEMCAGRKLEIEADLVSARLLAYAGFDPRAAIRFWESRIDKVHLGAPVGCAIQGKTEETDWSTTASWAMGREIHPLNEERVQKLKQELERWELEWSKRGKKM